MNKFMPRRSKIVDSLPTRKPKESGEELFVAAGFGITMVFLLVGVFVIFPSLMQKRAESKAANSISSTTTETTYSLNDYVRKKYGILLTEKAQKEEKCDSNVTDENTGTSYTFICSSEGGYLVYTDTKEPLPTISSNW